MSADTRTPGQTGNIGANVDIKLPHLMLDPHLSSAYLFVAPPGTVGRETVIQAMGTRVIDLDENRSVVGVEFLPMGEFVDAELDKRPTDGIPVFDLREFPGGGGLPTVEEVVLLFDGHDVPVLVDEKPEPQVPTIPNIRIRDRIRRLIG